MTKNELLKLMGSWETVFLLRHGSKDPLEYLPDLMEIALESNDRASWRALWLVDKINDMHPGAVVPWLDTIIKMLPGIKHSGKKRQFLRLITTCNVPGDQAGFLFGYCQEQLLTPGEAIAVKAYSMQIMYNISEMEKELKEELLQTIEQEMEQRNEPGILARGKKLAVRLQKQIAGKSKKY